MATQQTSADSRPPAKRQRGEGVDYFAGECYCGAVEYRVAGDATVLRSVFCHCESCRRAHASPLYQVIYVMPGDFSITRGEGLLKECRFKANPKKGSRSFCSECGTRVANFIDDALGARTGFFPNTLPKAQLDTLPLRFRPKMHHCPEEAVIPLTDDGLERQPNRYAAAAGEGNK
eukprot:Hpha_TRINITY_DN33517_c0_g1::TRINITY_DN33517_c0_g1_i1::g.171000::m.171000